MIRAIGLLSILLFSCLPWFFFGPNILTIGSVVFFGFIVGFIGGGAGLSRTERDSQNIADLAQIERNRYFRKPEV